MLVEVSVAINYILSHLYTKLPRRRVDSFGEELERCLHAKFQYNWFPNDPTRGSTFRCINVVGPRVDQLLPEAAAVSGLDWSEIQACLPDGLVLTIDPGHVACQYQQASYMTSDSTRNPFRSSASLSLSSSGCSSASSSISSTNLTPNTGQVTHQVLYCVQDSWLACNKNQWSDDSSNNGVDRIIPSDSEHGDHLATAAALSVLIDTEDCTGAAIGPMSAQTSRDSGQTQSLWGAEINQQGSSEPVLGFNLRDTGFNSMESCKQDFSNECETKPVNTSLPWSVPEGETENTLISMLTTELSGFSGSTQHSSIMNETTQLFPFVNRSSSNPPHMDQPNTLCYQDLISAPNTGGDTVTMMSPFQTKLDQPTEPQFGLMNGRLNSMYKPTLAALNTAATNHFVQKSLSTPSFTAATFAQTKFGSTKLKNHTKRTANRIISPTTVQQQTFAPINGIEMTHREPTLLTLLSGTQRIPAAQYTDLSSFNTCTPLLIEAISDNNHNINSTNNIVRNKSSLISQFSFPIEDTSNIGLSYEKSAQHPLIAVTKTAVPSTSVKGMKCYVNSLETQTLPHQPTSCVPTASTNALDDLFACPINDEIERDFLGKLNFSERIPAAQYTDLSSFNTCTPLLIEAISDNNHNINSTNNIVRNKSSLISQFSFPIEDTSNIGLSYEKSAQHPLIAVTKTAVPSTSVKGMKCYVNSLETQTLPHQPTSCVPTASTNALDDLFACPINDEIERDFLGKLNFSESGMQTSVNSVSLWPVCPMRLNRQSQEGLSRDFYATTDWKQTSSLGPTNGPKQQYANICANGTLRSEDNTSLHDDSILSNRMVNLLLEEDSSNDGVVQDSEKAKGSVLLKESSITEGFGDNGQQNMHEIGDGIASYITDLDNLRTIGKEARSNTGQ
ncbi:hypothetical protein AHF37_01143 [Paragonimus kellicotti]|nr:hypothetical protein AHF37_01143 [Paragonimus kellicotti]